MLPDRTTQLGSLTQPCILHHPYVHFAYISLLYTIYVAYPSFKKEWYMDEIKKDVPVAIATTVAPRRALILEDP